MGEKGLAFTEQVSARKFWNESLSELCAVEAGVMTVLLAEEALMLRMLTHRLLMNFGAGSVMVNRNTPPWVLNPAVDAWLKIQERLRKVMKELLEECRERDGGSSLTLASMMIPILEQGEGVLDDALEFEAGKESVKKAGDGPDGD